MKDRRRTAAVTPVGQAVAVPQSPGRDGHLRRTITGHRGTIRPAYAAPGHRRASGRACARGGAGERLLGGLGMAMDADTIVHVVKRGAPPPDVDETLRVVGIDDWAWQKGQQHFGTIFVDLERRRGREPPTCEPNPSTLNRCCRL